MRLVGLHLCFVWRERLSISAAYENPRNRSEESTPKTGKRHIDMSEEERICPNPEDKEENQEPKDQASQSICCILVL